MKPVPALILAVALLTPAAAWSAEGPPPAVPAQAPDLTRIPLRLTGSPLSETWVKFGGTDLAVRNVTQPALIPVLPKPGTANGTAVVIAPGGAFMILAMDTEGLQVAHALADRGITCFVLAYRVDATPVDEAEFAAFGAARMATVSTQATHTPSPNWPAITWAQEDGLAAMAWVRGHATDYGIDPHRIGFMGFSAGGMTTTNVATHYDAETRPDFIGVIYGAMNDVPVPADAPPAFVALAADDPLLGFASTPIFDAWRAAGRSAELHIYAHGSHGFGMRKTGTSSEHWIEDFQNWLVSEQMTTAK